MKKIVIKIALISFLVIASQNIFSQPPDPPGNGHGQNGDQPAGGNAPIGSGMVILMSMAVAYGSKKYYNMHHQKNK